MARQAAWRGWAAPFRLHNRRKLTSLIASLPMRARMGRAKFDDISIFHEPVLCLLQVNFKV